jgi:ABC-type Mn2+/Zn2+ transport system permease subunit/Mn-dependent DtxR family transcriptional regulator
VIANDSIFTEKFFQRIIIKLHQMEILQTLQYEWAMRALIASSMIGVMCGILGVFIVLRNMSLIGDALSHAVLPGVVLGFVVAGYSVFGFFSGAVFAGIVTAVLITWLQRNVPIKNDAAMGIVFTAMFSIGVMWISRISRQDGVHLDLKDFLFGNALGVSNEDLYLTGAITVFVILSVVIFYRYLFATTFQVVIAETLGIPVKMVYYFLMLLLSLSIVASLKAVGVILVVSMLIAPAATALLLSDRLQKVVVISAFIGLLSAIIGLVLAIKLETTPGPAMAVTASTFFLLAVFFSPKKGLLFKYLYQYRIRKKVEREDTLKQALKLHEQGTLSLPNLVERLGFSSLKVKAYLSKLRQQGLLEWNGNTISMNKSGIQAANKLVRAHRLWETYLVNQAGMSEEQIHEDAERLEHILTDDVLDEVDHELGYPKTDPHGSPIPKKFGYPEVSLDEVLAHQSAIIATEQLNENISSQLWQMGLLPDSEVIITQHDTEQVVIQQNNKQITVPLNLAKRIHVIKK